MVKIPAFIITFLMCLTASATPDWSANAVVPEGGRGNIYDWSAEDLLKYQNQGKLHAQVYPVTVTGILPPYAPVKRLLEEDSRNPLRNWLQSVLATVSGIDSFKDILLYLGLHNYPKSTDTGVYSAPHPQGLSEDELMGFGVIERGGAKGFTFSCAACHSANLFGKTVLGMTNRFPRANELFVNAKKAIPLLDPHLFQLYSGATNAERRLLEETKKSLGAVDLKTPIVLGLDTSLAQVSLSLNRRNKDAYATLNPYYESHPRKDAFLDVNPADSKPAVWWNLKYKNRWLSDGSVLSGNPIFTNLIWNEIGRGADLQQLEQWLSQNERIVQEFTTAVFASEAPRITDFYPAEKIDLGRAKAGEQIFNQNCARCHGHYDKAWNLPYAAILRSEERLKTTAVRYHSSTPVVNVGTDPFRRLGMKSLEQLNDLEISKKNGIVIKAQNGYVPPPLVGIWARWPYFHNNSIPNLCVLLTPSNRRPLAYYAGEALNKDTDYDFDCGGYPLGHKTPASWIKYDRHYDTRRRGMSNVGHDENIFIRDGKEILSAEDKKNLIQYLQTL